MAAWSCPSHGLKYLCDVRMLECTLLLLSLNVFVGLMLCCGIDVACFYKLWLFLLCAVESWTLTQLPSTMHHDIDVVLESGCSSHC